jgi:peptidoglycan-associated lipoprotein
MYFHRLAPAGVAALLAASSLGAQGAHTPGTVEIGGFGQFTAQADTFGIENPIGFGVRIGGFFTPRWQLEGDFSYGAADEKDVTGRDEFEVGYSTLAARINYNWPLAFGTNSSFVIGAGVVRTNYKVDLDDDPNTIGAIFGEAGPVRWAYGASGLVGLRFGITPQFAVRLDAIPEYHPDPEAFNISGRAGLSYMLVGGPAMSETDMAMAGGARQPGTLEAGIFANYPILAGDWNLVNALGFGARAGVFMTPRWQFEGEFAYSEADVDDVNARGQYDTRLTKESYNYVVHAARLNYNIPFGTRSSFVLGVGPVRSHYEYTYNYGGSGLAGFRFAVGDMAAIRADVVGNYMPEPSAFDVNLRAGLSAFLGGARPTEAPPVVAMPEPTPPVDTTTPPPVDTAVAVAPVDTMPPAVDSAAIRDSLARAASASARSALTAPIFFGFDRSDLNDSARTTLDAKVPVLQANPSVRLRIAGNADPRGSDEYNLALGQRRANSARRYLVQRGVPVRRLETVSYGEERRNCTEETEDCYAQNRRNEFEIIAGDENLTLPAAGQQPPDEQR